MLPDTVTEGPWLRRGRTELGQPGLVRHGLRHTALTWMADAGVELHILQRSLAATKIRRSLPGICTQT
jgi:integrase